MKPTAVVGEAAGPQGRRHRPPKGPAPTPPRTYEETPITVFTASLAAARLTGPDFDAPCALGSGGVIDAAQKREGDKKSPIGVWPVRKAWWRADRIARPETALVIDPLEEIDGWCDAPEDPAYNRAVVRPYAASHEAMWREDGLYDIVVALGHNDNPPEPGLGSAIFLHCALPAESGGLKPTAGCVALPRTDLLSLMACLTRHDSIEIVG